MAQKREQDGKNVSLLKGLYGCIFTVAVVVRKSGSKGLSHKFNPCLVPFSLCYTSFSTTVLQPLYSSSILFPFFIWMRYLRPCLCVLAIYLYFDEMRITLEFVSIETFIFHFPFLALQALNNSESPGSTITFLS